MVIRPMFLACARSHVLGYRHAPKGSLVDSPIRANDSHEDRGRRLLVSGPTTTQGVLPILAPCRHSISGGPRDCRRNATRPNGSASFRHTMHGVSTPPASCHRNGHAFLITHPRRHAEGDQVRQCRYPVTGMRDSARTPQHPGRLSKEPGCPPEPNPVAPCRS